MGQFIGNNIFAIITAIIAVIALWQTHRQITISNKHQLFDKRVDRFITINGLISLFKESKHLMDKEDYDHFIDVTVLFHSLTNNIYLKDIGTIIDNVEQEDIRQNFLIKLEEIKKLSIEMKFLFNGDCINLIKEFVYEYQELLRLMYKEQIILNRILEKNSKNSTEFIKLQKEFGERKFREDLYTEYDKIKQLYEAIIEKNIINNIENQIKL
jgi:hypothetical protein